MKYTQTVYLSDGRRSGHDGPTEERRRLKGFFSRGPIWDLETRTNGRNRREKTEKGGTYTGRLQYSYFPFPSLSVSVLKSCDRRTYIGLVVFAGVYHSIFQFLPSFESLVVQTSKKRVKCLPVRHGSLSLTERVSWYWTETPSLSLSSLNLKMLKSFKEFVIGTRNQDVWEYVTIPVRGDLG